MAKTVMAKTTKKHNIKVTIIEVNEPSAAATKEFNRLLNQFASKLAKKVAA